jgi:hypothetical protein
LEIVLDKGFWKTTVQDIIKTAAITSTGIIVAVGTNKIINHLEKKSIKPAGFIGMKDN